MKVSPLTLGTVQLGLNYGIANDGGKPDQAVGEAILKEALQSGITTWDTSRYYGNSEEVIGGFLTANSREAADLLVVSKFKWSVEAMTDLQKARQEAKDSVRQSLKALGIPVLPILLYHKGKDEPIDQLLRFLPMVVNELQEEGLIRKGGISLYYPDEAMAVVEERSLQAVQVPINIFDQRVLRNGGLARMRERGSLVFARSVFLQGLFFLDEGKIPSHLRDALPFLQRLRRLAQKAQMDVAQLAFSYVRDLTGVTSVVFGAENPDQVKQNAALQQAPALPLDIREEIADAFQQLPLKVITPGMW